MRLDEVVDMRLSLGFLAAWGHGPICTEQTSSTIFFYFGLQGDLQLISELWKCHTLEDQNAYRLVLGFVTLVIGQLGLCNFRAKVVNSRYPAQPVAFALCRRYISVAFQCGGVVSEESLLQFLF